MTTRVSIIIDNYNYAKYLRRAIDSALGQTYDDVEVIVVDDGSTDESRDLISQYGDRIRRVFKDNGGQGSAFNAGFRESSGEIIVFLDSDDVLEPQATAVVTDFMDSSDAVKVHWPMRIIDQDGVPTGEVWYKGLPGGDLRRRVALGGPGNSPSSPTSGNAWRRSLLERVMPVPEDCQYYRTCGDEYLYNLAPFFGDIGTIDLPLTLYRIHGANIFSSRPFSQKFQIEVDGYAEQCGAILSTLRRNNIAVDPSRWREHSWFPRLHDAIQLVRDVMPEGSRVALIHDGALDELDVLFPDHDVRHFPERDGIYWGAPASDEDATTELNTALSTGIDFVAMLWPSFWWTESYPTLAERLRTLPPLLENDDCMVFRVRREDASERIRLGHREARQT